MTRTARLPLLTGALLAGGLLASPWSFSAPSNLIAAPRARALRGGAIAVRAAAQTQDPFAHMTDEEVEAELARISQENEEHEARLREMEEAVARDKAALKERHPGQQVVVVELTAEEAEAELQHMEEEKLALQVKLAEMEAALARAEAKTSARLSETWKHAEEETEKAVAEAKIEAARAKSAGAVATKA